MAVSATPYYADHHGDLIVVIDAYPGMGVVWGAEGAQERDMLLELSQGRAVSKGLLNLACVFVFGPHGHHLRGMRRIIRLAAAHWQGAGCLSACPLDA